MVRKGKGEKEAANEKFCDSFRHGRIRLRQRADSHIWYAAFRVPNKPNTVERSLGTTLKREAVAEAEQLSSRLLNETYGVADGSSPLPELLERFFDDMGDTAKPMTKKRIRMTTDPFLRWVETHAPEGLKAVKYITRQTITTYRNHRTNEDGVSSRTADNDVRNLHQVFRWAIGRKLVPSSPANYARKEAGAVKLSRKPDEPPVPYTHEQYERLLAAAAAAGDGMMRDMITLFANTGMRYEEGAWLRPECLHWHMKQPFIEIRARSDWTPKDPHEKKSIPMCPEVQEVLRRREAACSGGYLFANKNGVPLANKDARKQAAKLRKAAGIRIPRLKPWHSWRAYFIVRCLNARISPLAVMKWTGHDSVAMVMHYASMTDEQGFQEFAKLEKVGEDSGKSFCGCKETPANTGAVA